MLIGSLCGRQNMTLYCHPSPFQAELSAMLCRYGTVSADAAHVRRLQCALSQRDGEIQMLTGRLQKAEKQQVCVLNPFLSPFHTPGGPQLLVYGYGHDCVCP